MEFTGLSIIGSGQGAPQGNPFYGVNAATGERLETAFYPASQVEVEKAIALASDAFEIFGKSSGASRGAFLRKIAEKLDASVDAIVEIGMAETGLPEPRLRGETGRTTGQLRLFASVAESGHWVDARIDHAIPDRTPIPKPDVRSQLEPLGPVAVFGASNFPLAFSVAGGDTASAFAAGNPVIAKAHPGHPGVSELVGRIIQESIAESELPAGVFSLLFDSGHEVGISLAGHPGVLAIGFTGSRVGGRALMDIAAQRPSPIPVYTEMSSVNPLLYLPGAVSADPEKAAEGFVGSITLGVGQFCTKPGLVLLCKGQGSEAFKAAVVETARNVPEGTMLHAGICKSYESGVAERKKSAGVATLLEPKNDGACPWIFETDASTFIGDEDLMGEIFGPTTLIVNCEDLSDAQKAIDVLDGQLTASVFGDEATLSEHGTIIDAMTATAGRVIFNQFPTGVEVCHSMVHGGPYPATSDGRSTSVGTGAILRYARPVCYQNWPDALLPDALKESNPLGVRRLVDGAYA